MEKRSFVREPKIFHLPYDQLSVSEALHPQDVDDLHALGELRDREKVSWSERHKRRWRSGLDAPAGTSAAARSRWSARTSSSSWHYSSLWVCGTWLCPDATKQQCFTITRTHSSNSSSSLEILQNKKTWVDSRHECRVLVVFVHFACEINHCAKMKVGKGLLKSIEKCVPV